MNKRLVYGIALPSAAALLLSAVALGQAPGNNNAAQPAPSPNCMQMMQGGMGMGGGMAMNGMGMRGAHFMMMRALQNPAARTSMMAFVLPEMQSQLGLSQAQASQLDQLKTQLVNREQNTSREIAAKRQELNSLFSSKTPNQQQIRTNVNAIAQLQAERLLNSYETGQNMEGVLTPEQRNRLESMQPAQLLNTMTASMTVDQMAEMVRYMHGAAASGMLGGTAPGPMMSRGMMNGNRPMMNGGMMGGQGMRSRSVPQNSGQQPQEQPSPQEQPNPQGR